MLYKLRIIIIFFSLFWRGQLTTLTKFDIPACGTMAWIESAQWSDRDKDGLVLHSDMKVTECKCCLLPNVSWISNINGNRYEMWVKAVLLCLVWPKSRLLSAVNFLQPLPRRLHSLILFLWSSCFKTLTYLRKWSLCLELIAVYLFNSLSTRAWPLLLLLSTNRMGDALFYRSVKFNLFPNSLLEIFLERAI